MVSSATLVGTWRLVAASNVTDKGIINTEPYGRNPIGLLTYTSDGRMMAIITTDGRKSLSKTWFAAPVRERAEAYATSLAYAGTYALKGNEVAHHVEASTFPNVVNTDVIQTVAMKVGKRMALRTSVPFVWRDGVRYKYQELVWEQVK